MDLSDSGPIDRAAGRRHDASGGRREARRRAPGLGLTWASLATRLASPRAPWVHLIVTPDGDGLPAPPPGFVARSVDGTRCASRDALLDELARALELPAYFGRSWDALEDCLTDLGWLPAAGYRLVLTAADRLLAGDAPAYAALVALLADVGRAWGTRRTGHPGRRAVPFHTVLLVSPERVRARLDWHLTPRPARAPGRRPGPPGRA